MSKENCSKQKIIASTHEFAKNDPEFAQLENQDAFMVKADFPAYEGPLVPDNYFKLGLVLQGEGILNYNTSLGSSSDKFYQGSMSATMPMLTGDYYSSPMNMLGICIDLDRFDSTSIGNIKNSDLEEMSQSLFADPVINSVMLALWHTSRGTDYSALFFRQGVEIILNRVSQLTQKRSTYIKKKKNSQLRLQRVHSFIADNLMENICVADMAKEAGISETQFFNLCKKITGMTPFAYLTHCRLQQAKKMLGDGASVIETSLAVGYTNPSKFSAAFRRHAGQTPSQWRKLNCLTLVHS